MSTFWSIRRRTLYMRMLKGLKTMSVFTILTPCYPHRTVHPLPIFFNFPYFFCIANTIKEMSKNYIINILNVSFSRFCLCLIFSRVKYLGLIHYLSLRDTDYCFFIKYLDKTIRFLLFYVNQIYCCRRTLLH